MRFISTRLHGMYDYLSGALLIIVPLVVARGHYDRSVWTPVVIGIMALGMSVMTRYELGIIRVLPMPIHLMMDIAAGLILAISPWMFGFAHVIWWPHLVVGLAEIGVAALTSPVPDLMRPTHAELGGGIHGTVQPR